MAKPSRWQFDWIQLSAVILVITLAAGLTGLVSSSVSRAGSVADRPDGRWLQAELTADQPTMVIQEVDQFVARFKLSTESIDPILVNGASFYAQGDLSAQLVKYRTLHPITVSVGGIALGRGDTWLFNEGVFSQSVNFVEPVRVDALHPFILDVQADLWQQYQSTFGVYLGAVDSPVITKGLPVQGNLFEVKERR